MKENDEDNNLKLNYTDEQVKEAVEIVNKAIKVNRKGYEVIANTDEQSPVELEGTTRTGHACVMMVDPMEVAQIFLQYDYPTWNVLGEEAPDEMWEEMARQFGLASVSSVDL